MVSKKAWDLFVCHAREDKDVVARPLAEYLRDKGYRVWYDEFSLTIGDSLLHTINEGIETADRKEPSDPVAPRLRGRRGDRGQSQHGAPRRPLGPRLPRNADPAPSARLSCTNGVGEFRNPVCSAGWSLTVARVSLRSMFPSARPNRTGGRIPLLENL